MITKKRRLILLLAIVATLVAILYATRKPPSNAVPADRLSLTEQQVDGFQVRTFAFRENDGRTRGLASTYWRKGESSLSPEDIAKIMQANAESATWTQESDDDLYRRWIRSDGRAGATYRKLDGRLCLFSDDFAEWSSRPNLSQRDAEILAQVME